MKKKPRLTTHYAAVFGVVVAQRRQRMGWNQTELAEAAGMTQPHVSRIERGAYAPGLNVLSRIAAVFDTPPSKLLDAVDNHVAVLKRARVAVNFEADVEDMAPAELRGLIKAHFGCKAFK